jgi:serine protease inhibitor
MTKYWIDSSWRADPMTRMVLVNAVYFKGAWMTPVSSIGDRKTAFFIWPITPSA